MSMALLLISALVFGQTVATYRTSTPDLDTVLRRLAEMEELSAKQNAQQLETIETLRATINSQHKNMEELSATVQNQKNRIEELSATVKNQQTRIQKLSATVQNQEHVLEELSATVQNQEHMVEGLSVTVRKQQHSLEVLSVASQAQQHMADKSSYNRHGFEHVEGRSTSTSRRQSENIVAFSATTNTDSITNVGAHQNLVFPDVITNVGHAYNNHHGVFTAPVSGIYMLSTTILSGHSLEFMAAIVINSAETVRLFERGTDGRHGSATQTIIVQLNKGDDVAVQNIVPTSEYYGGRFTSFSGVLLRETENGQIIG